MVLHDISSIRTENDDGIQRGYEILTLGVEVFHILEYDHLKLDSESLGQFHDSDTYVIRWHLMISQSGQYSLVIIMIIYK